MMKNVRGFNNPSKTFTSWTTDYDDERYKSWDEKKA